MSFIRRLRWRPHMRVWETGIYSQWLKDLCSWICHIYSGMIHRWLYGYIASVMCFLSGTLLLGYCGYDSVAQSWLYFIANVLYRDHCFVIQQVHRCLFAIGTAVCIRLSRYVFFLQVSFLYIHACVSSVWVSDIHVLIDMVTDMFLACFCILVLKEGAYEAVFSPANGGSIA